MRGKKKSLTDHVEPPVFKQYPELREIFASRGMLERRSCARYRLALPAICAFFVGKDKRRGWHRLTGAVLDMSSAGVCFKANSDERNIQRLQVGAKTVVNIQWPSKIDGTTPLQLSVKAIVVRIERGTVAMQISATEMRTAGANSRAQAC